MLLYDPVRRGVPVREDVDVPHSSQVFQPLGTLPSQT